MGLKDTGLSNNTPNDSEVSPNRDLEQPGTGEDSDSDLDTNDHWGDYMPLSQNPQDGEILYGMNDEESDEEEIDFEESGAAAVTESNHVSEPELKDSSTALVEEVWSKSAPKEVDIEMSDKKIDLVKQMMLNIQLPSEAIPAWAKDIPEEEWKDHLLQRLNKSDD